MSEPFAIEVYRRYLRGETIQQLASTLGIPADRIEIRIRVAENGIGLLGFKAPESRGSSSCQDLANAE